MKYILPYLRPYRRQTALAMVLVALSIRSFKAVQL